MLIFHRMLLLAVFFAFPGFLVEKAQAAEDIVARISEIKGAVIVTRGSEEIKGLLGMQLRNEDTLRTERDASIGILFNDETTLSLGPESRITIQEYAFNPEKSEFSFVVSLVKGTASYVSGLIAKISPESVKFITPSASIGIRGTKFVIQVDPI